MFVKIQINLDVMLSTCGDIRFTVKPKKVVTETTKLEFLGVTFDTFNMETCISHNRLADVMGELTQWLDRRHW